MQGNKAAAIILLLIWSDQVVVVVEEVSEGCCVQGTAPGVSVALLCAGLSPMRATRRRTSTTEHGHAVSTRGYQSDPWSVGRPLRRAPRSPPPRTHGRALTEVAPYQ